MEGHKKKFRKSLWLGMAYNGERGTETPIALTTTTTFSTTKALSRTTTNDTCCGGIVVNNCDSCSEPSFGGKLCCGPSWCCDSQWNLGVHENIDIEYCRPCRCLANPGEFGCPA